MKLPRHNRLHQIYLLKRNFKNIFKGACRYYTKYPLKSLPLFYKRMAFSFWRGSINKPFKTPEGLILKDDMELLVHSQEFIEQNLYYKPFIDEFMEIGDNRVIDVGSNVGLFTQWLGTFNSKGIFYNIEIWDSNIKRAIEINNKKLSIMWYNKAAYNKTDEKIKFNIGDSVTTVNTTGIIEQKEILTLAIDSYWSRMNIFCMKIDTDGSNIKVLEGAKETLKRTKWLLIEIEEGVMGWLSIYAPYMKLMSKTSPDDLIYKNTTV